MAGTPPPGPRAKIARAKKHLGDLADIAQAIRHGRIKPYTAVRQFQPDGKLLIGAKKVEGIPGDIALIFGDLVHNLRSALDILVCDLIRKNREPVPDEAGFPIVDRPDQLGNRAQKKMKGSGHAAKEAVRRLQPYEAGNRDLWVLHQLDIRDKHNILLTVQSDASGLDFRGVKSNIKLMQEDGTLLAGLGPFKSTRPNRVKDGDIILGPVDPLEPDDEVAIGFAIAIDEPGIVDCEPFIPLGQKLVDLVEGIVVAFDPLFS